MELLRARGAGPGRPVTLLTLAIAAGWLAILAAP